MQYVLILLKPIMQCFVKSICKMNLNCLKRGLTGGLPGAAILDRIPRSSLQSAAVKATGPGRLEKAVGQGK